MMIHRCRLLFLLILLMTPAGCGQASVVTPQPTTIVIAGSTAMQPVLTALANAFIQEHPNVLFDIRGGGSHLGEERLMRDEVDMAASTLFPTEDANETNEVATPIYTPIGLDGLALIVNRRNAVDDLTITEIRDLFGGQLLTWSKLLPQADENVDDESSAGETVGQEVLLVSREDGSGSRALFEEVIMGEDSVALTAVVMPSSADVVDFVGTQPNAVGYVSHAYLTELGTDETGDVRAVRVEGIDPSADDYIEQGYLLTHPLFLLTADEPDGWSRTFIDFVLSPTGQEIIDRYHTRIR